MKAIKEIINTAYANFESKNFDSSLSLIDEAEEVISKAECNSIPEENVRAGLLSSIYDFRGFIYLGLNNINEAENYFEKSINTNPQSSQALVGLAEVSYLNDKIQVVEEILDKIKNIKTSGNYISKKLVPVELLIKSKIFHAMFLRREMDGIQELIEQNQIDQAEEAAMVALVIFPDNLDLLNNYSVILAMLNHYRQSLNTIQRILAIDPENQTALGNHSAIQNMLIDSEMQKHEKIELFLELNTYCNYKCTFCANPNLNDKTMISLSDVKGLDEMVDKARMVDITGYGEVTLLPKFEETLAYFTEKNTPVRFVTNGSNLSEKVCNQIFNSSVAEMVISVNSLNREIYKKMMGVDKLELVLGNIEYLVKGYKGVLEFSFVISSANFHEIKDFIDLGAKYNKHVACLGLTPTLNYAEEMKLENTPEVREKIEEYKRYAQEKNVSLFIFSLENQTGTDSRTKNLPDIIKGCNWVYSKFFVSATGNVTPCCWPTGSMGNIFEESFTDIWYGEKYTELRKLVMEGDPKYCYKCRREG